MRCKDSNTARALCLLTTSELRDRPRRDDERPVCRGFDRGPPLAKQGLVCGRRQALLAQRPLADL